MELRNSTISSKQVYKYNKEQKHKKEIEMVFTGTSKSGNPFSFDLFHENYVRQDSIMI